MFLFCKVVDHRGFVYIIDSSFSTKALDVCDLVDTKCMSLIYWCAVYMFRCVYCLLWRLVFNESIAIQSAHRHDSAFGDAVPFRFPFSVDGHIESIFLDFPRRVELFGEETDKLGFV